MQEYKYLDKEKMDIIKNYAIECYKKHENKDYDIFLLMTKLFSFDKYPQIYDDQKYNSTASNIFYRGVKDIEHHANLFCDFNYHVGQGLGSNGIYLTKRKNIAENYTAKYGYSTMDSLHNAENVTQLKISPDCKVDNIYQIKDEFINHETPREEIKELQDYIINQVPAPYVSELIRIFNNDMGKVAIAIGIDALGGNMDILTMLNRGKIIVSESEFKRIVSKSKYYNLNRTINFEAKYEDNFFPDL